MQGYAGAGKPDFSVNAGMEKDILITKQQKIQNEKRMRVVQGIILLKFDRIQKGLWH